MIESPDMIDRWLASGATARICGLDFRPLVHPKLANTARRVVKGQATVYVLQQVPHQNIWFLKAFAPSRRPTDAYLQAVSRCIPGGSAFFSCTQRRFLSTGHLDLRYSGFRDPAFADWLEGCILTPKVPGDSWACIADELRGGSLAYSLAQRLEIALNLAFTIGRLESADCSHRDLSPSNVFITPDGRVFLIDWDSVFHPSLPFQSNTTVGTNGLIAPFLSDATGQWDAAKSWCPLADRLALAILITEFLLTRAGGPEPREDGTLFAQKELSDPGSSFVQQQISDLAHISARLAVLLGSALSATSFAMCPSPRDWQTDLRKVIRLTESVSDSRPPGRYECQRCHAGLWLRQRHAEVLQRTGKPILCRSCLPVHLEELNRLRADRDQASIRASCEHCAGSFGLRRDKANRLQAEGKPILCPECLHVQLQAWEAEHRVRAELFPLVLCACCGQQTRTHKDKIRSLQAAGKSFLCKACREAPRAFRTPPLRIPWFR